MEDREEIPFSGLNNDYTEMQELQNEEWQYSVN